MAGYIKVWTTLKNNEAMLSLPLNARGAYLWLILTCKEQRDDGWIFHRNFAALAGDWGCDDSTAAKILRKLADNSLLTYSQNEQGVLSVNIPNYKHWQNLDVKGVVEKSRKIPRKIAPLKPDQSKPDQTKAIVSDNGHREAVDYFCKKYQENLGIPYDFKGAKDGTAIKRLLTTYKLDGLKILIDQLFLTQDTFITGQAGQSIGVLAACSNKLAQEASRQNRPLEQFSPKTRTTIKNLQEVLNDREKQRTENS